MIAEVVRLGDSLLTLTPKELEIFILAVNDNKDPIELLKNNISRVDTKRKINSLLRNIKTEDVDDLRHQLSCLCSGGRKLTSVNVHPLRSYANVRLR